MSYTITFRDKTTVTTDNEKGERLKQLWLTAKTSVKVEIGDDAYQSSEITSIKKFADPLHRESRSELPREVKTQNQNVPNCKAKHSIQQAINELISERHPSEHGKLADTTLREALRKELRAKQPDWCDYRAKTCACDERRVTLAFKD